MATAYIFPGQGAQFPGMGSDIYNKDIKAKNLIDSANEILGFNISQIMFTGTADDLQQTKVTQPAIFIHSIAAFFSDKNAKPDMVAGHSLGEFSALVANNVLSFEDALRLVLVRATAMQKACEASAGTMAAIIGLEDVKVEEICQKVTNDTGEIVVAANYNCPGQLVISGTLGGIEFACGQLKEAGAKRALPLPVGGAFHSPLMAPAREELAAAINATNFKNPACPVYQNVSGLPVTEPAKIKENLIAQLTGAVKWTQTVQNMTADGATNFVECGPGKVLQGLVLKVNREATVSGIS